MKVKGVNATIRKMDTLSRVYPNQTREALIIESDAIYQESQKQVPSDTLASSWVRRIINTARGMKIDMEYTAPYAVYVHEINKNYRVGKWKFLEDPLKKALPGLAKRVSEYVKKRIR